MMGYVATTGDVEAGAEESSEVLVEKKSSTGWMWKGFGILLIVALCVAGARLFVWYRDERPEPTSLPEAVVSSHSAEKTGTHSTLKQMIKKAKAAIHLEGGYEDGESPELMWSHEQGQAFTQGGFRLGQNQIIIPQSGLYFVYSQASFRVSCNSNEAGPAGRSMPLSHRIWRLSDSIGTKVSLMSAVRSACQNVQEDGVQSGQSCYSAIYLGAVFQLNKGDHLWTETNQLSDLETDEGKTFFGVFAL
ncbi:tumor necrosis factor b (TNF superfamily, member 2) [Nothobranchius furzeri]|uniref:Lymphotoxin-alpha n=3 Tax=Nothobranchius TaxID=28779 RepID=A0A8C6VT50_NOTFU|nr:tumor necrosis factor-like [Nothobranchius furzeri]